MNLFLAGLSAQTVTDLVIGASGVISIVFLVVLLFFGGYGLYGAYRLKKAQYLIPNRLMYPNYCSPDDCSDPVEYMDYILPRITIFGGVMSLCGVLIFLGYFIGALRSLGVTLILYVIPLIIYLWYNGCLKRSAKKYWK